MERNARLYLLQLPLLLLASSGCIVDLGKLGEEETDTDPTGDGTMGNTDGGANTDDGADTDTVKLDLGSTMPNPTERQVDILFVVDNSGTMTEEQAKLALAIPTLVSILDAAEPPVDYRIAVTTTDNGNPWCGTTGSESGNLRASSCRSRPAEFVFNGAVPIEGFDDSCGAICPEGLSDLQILDGKPWIDVQNTAGTTNVGTDVVDALRCMLPQGIDGCGFEQPLESTYLAMERFALPEEDAFGFHRDGALLAVMLVSDEVDCSHNAPESDEIFLPDGNRVFWSDPSSASPNSALCWNAGVACTDAGGGLLECEPESYDIDGNPGAAPEDAVLHPVERYTQALIARGAYVSAIYGVNADGSVTYQNSPDTQFQNDFGTGAGCESADGAAIPPVRMRQVVDTLGGNHGSVCNAVYDGPLVGFGNGILARLPQ